MLTKLSLRNAKRQAGDYLVYFITIVISAALIFAFNCIAVSEEIKNLSGMMKSIEITVPLASAAVILIVGWLVTYTVKFMLTRRSRELGTYMLLGIEKKKVASMFLYENLIIGFIALLIGFVFGNFIYQILRAILFALFELEYVFNFGFEPLAFLLSLIYFMLIYLFSLLLSRKRIKKTKIYDLINFDKFNETEIMSKNKNRKKLFTVSIILGIIGTLLLTSRNFSLALIGTAFIIFFMFGFFISFSSGVPAYFDKYPYKKYKKLNLPVFRILTSKLASMGITMSIISILITVTLITLGSGLVFKNLFERRLTLMSSFDIFIGSFDTQTDFSEYIHSIHENAEIKSEHVYPIYKADNDNFTQYIASKEENYLAFDYDVLMGISDYNKLREMMGYEAVTIESGTYIVQCSDFIVPLLNKYNEPLSVNNTQLVQSEFYEIPFTQAQWKANGRHFILIVPDDVLELQPISHLAYAAMLKARTSNALDDILQNIARERYVKNPDLDTIVLLESLKSEFASMYALIIFPLFYISIVLILVATAILTIQLLSDTNKLKKHFRILRNLGTETADICKILKLQFAIYYAMPAFPAVCISTIFLLSLASASESGVIVNSLHLWSIIGITMLLYFTIYFIYIVISYINMKRNTIDS